MLKKIGFFLLTGYFLPIFALPPGFVYLHSTDNSIEEDMRYAGTNNFVGRPIKGYRSPTCILTRKAALQLAKVQTAAKEKGYRLKVYDCYRPQQAVDDFYHWSLEPRDTKQKNAFYPRVSKSVLFEKGYIARYSGHTRGSTVDLTLVSLDEQNKTVNALKRCYDKTPAYLTDNSINMGTRFDCLDPAAHVHYSTISREQKLNRRLLYNLMKAQGFKGYAQEWWHFTLRNEPYPKKYFDFPVR